MKKLFVIFAVCLIMLTGCRNNNPSANLPPKNDNGTQAIDANDGAQQTLPPSKSGDSSVNDGGAVEAPIGDVVEIKEKMFIAQLNDVYLNQADYLGKTIKYEGMFTSYTWEEKGLTYYLVYRKSPGCCGADGQGVKPNGKRADELGNLRTIRSGYRLVVGSF